MKNILCISICVILLASCRKQSIEGSAVVNNVSMTANGYSFMPGSINNSIHLNGGANIAFHIKIDMNTSTQLKGYFSIEDPLITGSGRTIIKTNPELDFVWDPTQKAMVLSYNLNVAILASGREYTGHIVISGGSIAYLQQTDYLLSR